MLAQARCSAAESGWRRAVSKSRGRALVKSFVLEGKIAEDGRALAARLLGFPAGLLNRIGFAALDHTEWAAFVGNPELPGPFPAGCPVVFVLEGNVRDFGWR